jgi:outer membrane protein TolC
MLTIAGEKRNGRQTVRPRWALFVRFAFLCTVAQANLGCTRAYYHDYADNDVYGILKDRLFDWRWKVPERAVEADPHSRMADLTDPNHVPIVPDEVAARKFQVSNRFPFEYRFWNKRGTTPIEDLSWQPYVPVESDGKVLLSKDSIMRLAMVHSRDYQTEYENLYLAALQLTLARFQFMIQGFSIWNIFYSPLTGAGLVSTPSTTTSGSSTSGSTTSGSTTSGSSTSGSSTSGSTTSGTTAVANAVHAATKAPNLNNQLLLGSSNGFNLELMSGAQLLVNLANQIVFEYSNHGVQMVSPSLTVSLTQPLLAGAWARIVTQPLSLQERGVLYALRSFAEFRRQFYVSLVTGQGGASIPTLNGVGASYSSSTGYLLLLNSLQSIRNTEINLKSYKRNLDVYEEEVRVGSRSTLERDNIAQNYQQTRFTLLSAQANLQTTLDLFKISLGLPTELEVRIDDSVLDQFELNDDRLDKLGDRTDALFLKLLQDNVLGRAQMAESARALRSALDELVKVHIQAVAEMERWKAKLKRVASQGFSGPDAERNKELFDREKTLSEKIQTSLTETGQEIAKDQAGVRKFLEELDTTEPADATKALRDLIGKAFRARLSSLNVAQTQIRVYLIEFPKVDLTVNQAIQIALGNRLDLQNALATVTDTWRNVEYDANQLQGILNFQYNGIFNEAPNHAGLFRFDSSNSIQSFGLQFQAPINRRAQRNTYRADQIQYQRARRAYMLARDTVVQQIRFDMRQLVLQERSFEINREQVIIAARQLEVAEFNLRTSTEDTQSLTQLLINALTSVLTSRNSLISTWVSYETARMSLYRDFDLMDIDSNGVWTNENDKTAIDIALRHAESAPAFSLTIPARIPDLRPNVGSDSTFYVDVEPGGKPNQPPDPATGPTDDGPLRPSEFQNGPVPVDGARPGGALPAPPGPPGGGSPFAPSRPGP